MKVVPLGTETLRFSEFLLLFTLISHKKTNLFHIERKREKNPICELNQNITQINHRKLLNIKQKIVRFGGLSAFHGQGALYSGKV